MPPEFDVKRGTFDLNTFQQILEAMDGYPILPSYQGDEEDGLPVEPWQLPGMPDVDLDTWRYHVGFAVDRGFIQCWTPSQQTQTRNHVRRGGILNGTSSGGRTTTYYNLDPNVSSHLRPARLTYAGKEFIDNLNNQSIKDKALEAFNKWGLPMAMQVVTEAGKRLLPTEETANAPASQSSPHYALPR